MGTVAHDEYRCAHCNRIFKKTASEEEMRAEQATNGWQDLPNDRMCIVCDDCYKTLVEYRRN